MNGARLSWPPALAVLVVCAGLAGCDPGEGLFGVIGGDAPPRTTVVIDTDMTFDDALAILYLLQNEDVDLAAITVTGTGFATLEAGVDNALRLLALVGNTDVVVAAGAMNSRSSGMTQDDIPDTLRIRADALLGVPLPEAERSATSDPVEVVLRGVLDGAKGDVIVLTTGPMTNLANAIEIDPTIAERIARLVTFGGAFQVPGNVIPDGSTDTPVAEWNMYLDPVAAEEVFSAGIPTDLVPLDAARRAPLTRDFISRLAARGDSSGASFAAAGLTVLLDEGAIDAGYDLSDPLAAALTTNPEISSYEVVPVRVVTVGDSIGRTLVDVTGDSLRVAGSVATPALEDLLLDGLTPGN
ncbi:MAG: nucleoside hydrolase [Gemmatimonadota bacterium]